MNLLAEAYMVRLALPLWVILAALIVAAGIAAVLILWLSRRAR
jgi:hypothetical protein